MIFPHSFRFHLLMGRLLLLGIAATMGCAQPAVRENKPRRAPIGVTPNIGRVAETSANEWLGDGANLSFLANLDTRYDGNIFLTQIDETSDTVITATPRLEFQYGRKAQFHGKLGIEEAFTRYARKTAPNANLAAGDASIAYTGASVSANASITFRQNYQNTREVAAMGLNQVNRSDSLNIHASAETILTGKTSFSAGADFNRLKYKTAGLIGTQDLAFPVKFFLNLTPKVSLSAGGVYRSVNPPGSTTDGRDMGYNVGVRGDFTPLMSGQFSVGYLTRKVADNPSESMFTFDGLLSYQVSSKTSSTMSLSRDFGTGAQGASLQTTSYGFSLMTVPTPQWQFGTGLSYRRVAYGPVVFPGNPAPPVAGRNDDYWEGNLYASFQPTSSLSTSLKYIASSNHSSQSVAEYANNVLNLTIGWKY